jgi:hypothetical protein
MNADVIKSSIQGVIDGLTPLASKMGIAVEAIFTWAIKHNYAVGLTMLLSLPLAIIFTTLSYNQARKVKDWQYFRKQGDGVSVAFMVIFGLIALITTIATFAHLPEAIDRLIAPEWNASKDIYELIKK